MASDALRQIYMRSPLGSCETAALTALLGLARDQDFSAILALAAIMAFELGGSDESGGWRQAADLPDLFRRSDAPSLCRLYAAGFLPRLYLGHVALAAQVATAGGPLAASPEEFAALQRLIERESPLQHEVMKAIILGALAVSCAGETIAIGSRMSGGARLAAVDKIMEKCRIVPGNNATSDFEFGRDLIMRARRPEDLVFVIYHELGHWIFRSGPEAAETSLLEEQIPAVFAALPNMLHSALRLAGSPPTPEDGRRLVLTSGLSILCTYEQTFIGSAIHLSLTRQGGPIDLTIGSCWAYAILNALGVDLASAAVAYSSRGMLHFGFSGRGPKPARVRRRVASSDLKALASNLAQKSRDWLASLREAGRFVADEKQWMVLVGTLPPSPRFYGANVGLAMLDHGIAVRLHHPQAPVRDDRKVGLAQAAVRCADARALEGALQAGDRPADADLGALGFSLCALGQAGRSTYYGPTPEGVLEILGTLRSEGVDLDAPLNDDGATLLQQAAPRSLEALKFLLSHGSDPRRASKRGRTALLIAARFGSADTVRALVEAGADLETRDEDGVTPLMGGVRHGDESIVRFLLQHGANPDAADYLGATPLMAAQSAAISGLLISAGADPNAALPDGESILMRAAGQGRSDLVATLLEAGADVDVATDDGVTALLCCAPWFGGPGHLACAALLIQAGADVDETTKNGKTALMLAVEHLSSPLVKLLIESGAIIDATDRDGDTALIRAVRPPNKSHLEIVALLLEAGADPRRSNKRGETALLLAAASESDEVRPLLERASEGRQ